MSELVVAGFKGEFTADEVLLDLLKMKQIHLIDLDYAVVAVRRDDGTITVKHSNVLVRADATAGCQWGIIIGGLAGLIINRRDYRSWVVLDFRTFYIESRSSHFSNSALSLPR